MLGLFGAPAVATLAAGVVLALSSDALSTRFHIQGVLFGATVLAAVTALPELTTGLYAVRAGRYELAMSDIMAGNAFLPVLFLFGTLISGQASAPRRAGPRLYLTALGALLTAVYCVGVILRSKRMVLGAASTRSWCWCSTRSASAVCSSSRARRRRRPHPLSGRTRARRPIPRSAA